MSPIEVPLRPPARRTPARPPRPAPSGAATTAVPGTSAVRSATPQRVRTAAATAVELQVRSVDRSILFWRFVVGLQVLDERPGVATLGVADRPLVVLRGGARTSALPGRSGLDHVALQVPDALELGRALARMLASRVPITATDDGRTMALHLTDPDGLGLAITLGSDAHPGGVAHAGGVGGVGGIGGTETVGGAGGDPGAAPDGSATGAPGSLDLTALLDLVGDEDLRRRLPAGTVIGGVALAPAEPVASAAFYRLVDLAAPGTPDERGAAPGSSGPDAAAVDTAVGGAAAGPSPAPESAARLLRIHVRIDGPHLAAALERLPASGPRDGGHLVRDPDGVELLLTSD